MPLSIWGPEKDPHPLKEEEYSSLYHIPPPSSGPPLRTCTCCDPLLFSSLLFSPPPPRGQAYQRLLNPPSREANTLCEKSRRLPRVSSPPARKCSTTHFLPAWSAATPRLRWQPMRVQPKTGTLQSGIKTTHARIEAAKTWPAKKAPGTTIPSMPKERAVALLLAPINDRMPLSSRIVLLQLYGKRRRGVDSWGCYQEKGAEVLTDRRRRIRLATQLGRLCNFLIGTLWKLAILDKCPSLVLFLYLHPCKMDWKSELLLLHLRLAAAAIQLSDAFSSRQTTRKKCTCFFKIVFLADGGLREGKQETSKT